MKHLTMLITPDGRWVVEDSDEFFEALGDARPDYDAAQFAVKNLGFIKFQIHEQSLIEIELHPYTVELPALLAAQQQLLMSKVRLFRVKYFDTAWQSEILSSADLAVNRLSELCAPKFAPPPHRKFSVERRDHAELLYDEANPLRLMLQKWRMSFGNFNPGVISFAIDHQLLSRMMIAGITPPANDPIFRFIGDGFNFLADDYKFYGVGERIANLPDREYGAWLANFYTSVAETGQPRYDHVTASIDAAPPYPSLTRYERLLLPWRTPSSEILVSLSSRRFDPAPGDEPRPSNPEMPAVRIAAKSS